MTRPSGARQLRLGQLGNLGQSGHGRRGWKGRGSGGPPGPSQAPRPSGVLSKGCSPGGASATPVGGHLKPRGASR